MRKLCRYLLVTMCLALGLCGTAGAVGAAVSKTADCVYSSYAGYWADPAKAYLYADDEELVRVELIDGEVVVLPGVKGDAGGSERLFPAHGAPIKKMTNDN